MTSDVRTSGLKERGRVLGCCNDESERNRIETAILHEAEDDHLLKRVEDHRARAKSLRERADRRYAHGDILRVKADEIEKQDRHRLHGSADDDAPPRPDIIRVALFVSIGVLACVWDFVYAWTALTFLLNVPRSFAFPLAIMLPVLLVAVHRFHRIVLHGRHERLLLGVATGTILAAIVCVGLVNAVENSGSKDVPPEVEQLLFVLLPTAVTLAGAIVWGLAGRHYDAWYELHSAVRDARKAESEAAELLAKATNEDQAARTIVEDVHTSCDARVTALRAGFDAGLQEIAGRDGRDLEAIVAAARAARKLWSTDSRTDA
jgi:hypothetical protein